MNKNVLNHRLLSLLVSGACMSLSAQAQNVTVIGRVQDTTGEPVAFATVMVPGSKAVTQTDANGNFKSVLQPVPICACRISAIKQPT